MPDTESSETRTVSRAGFLAEKIVIVDGLFGCGKTMLSPIVGALDRVELLTYSFEIEYVCALYFLGRISRDGAVTLLRMLTDLTLYNAMMSREVNLRPSDLSSVFRSAHPFRYLRRLLQKGDEIIPERIRRERPILHLTTHNLLGISEPLFYGLEERVVFIEMVRHPLYMIKQQTLNMERLHGDVRDFTIYFQWQGRELPFFACGWEYLYLDSTPAERAIYYTVKTRERSDAVRERMVAQYGAQILTIPFEAFVRDPSPYLEEMTKLLGTSITHATRKMMRKQHVPRKRYAEGIALSIYKRCGWEPPVKGGSEREELAKRRQFVVERGASAQALEALDRLSAQYETQYMISGA